MADRKARPEPGLMSVRAQFAGAAMKAYKVNGELVAVGGGDNIPLLRGLLTVGRRGSCDICLRFPNISGMHCELRYKDGYWEIRDLNSTNGIKVNGERMRFRPLRPGDRLT